MSVTLGLFCIIAAATGLSALMVVVSQNIVRAAIWLLFTLIGVSMLYFLMGFEFLGASQLIIYVGGTLVLVVFGVMLTAQGPYGKARATTKEWIFGSFLALCMLAMLINAQYQSASATKTWHMDEVTGTSIGALGLAFANIKEDPNKNRYPFGYLLPFEIVSVHLLVVLVGAAYLARAKRRPPSKEIGP